MIKLENLDFSHKDKPIIKNISLEFEVGKLYCILGPNGCGKTTLINLMSRALSPQKGSIILDGKEIKSYSQKELAKKISLLPQGRNMPETTVEQLVFYGRYPYMGIMKKPTQKDAEIISYALERAGVSHLKDRTLDSLSGGERQSAYIAMLLAQDTPCILLDEPTTYLDISNEISLITLLKALANEGKCVIAVLHNIPSALKAADRVLVMKSGENVFFGESENAIKSGVFKDVFKVDIVKTEVDGRVQYVVI